MAKGESDPLRQEMNGFIGEGTTLEGDLRFEGGYRVDGRISGRLTSSAAVIVGPPGEIDAEELRAGSLLVSGSVRGRLLVHDRLEILPGGRVVGSVTLAGPGFVMAPGAIFEGTLEMEHAPASGGPPKD